MYNSKNDESLLVAAYNICLEKFNCHIELYGDVTEPYELSLMCKNGNYYKECEKQSFYFMYNWQTSFITGLAPLFYKTEKNTKYLEWAQKFAAAYRKKVFDYPLETMHDIGFLYSPYSVSLYKITGSEIHKETALKAADELAKRFDLKGGYIDAWGKMNDDDRQGRAIIDCMMNISLLLWAWKESGHTFYRDIAVIHAETTKQYFIRDDFSVAHSFNFDRLTGDMIGENNGCGYENGSYWARGGAWAAYGFAILARYTDKNYANLAEKIIEKYKDSLDGSYVPVWDFRLQKSEPARMCRTEGQEPLWDETDSNNCRFNVDTSAAAIMSCALLELYSQTGNKEFYTFAENTLKTLCQEEFFNSNTKTPGILKKQNGQNVYTLFGDYFFSEGLQRLLFGTDTCW